MKKWLKRIFGILIIIFIMVVLGAILLVTFVDPNKFKPLLTDQVQKRTGRQLTISGDLSWTFYPYLGVKIEHAELGNPPGFTQKNFAELDSVTVGIKLFPLLHKKFESSGITLSGLKLNLTKNASGQTNWDDLQKSKKQSSAKVDAAVALPQQVVNNNPANEQDKSIPRSAYAIAITGIEIENAEINFVNEQTKEQLTINRLNFSAKNISLNQFFPITTEFHFDNKAGISGDVNVDTNLSLNVEKQLYQFKNAVFAIEVRQGNKDIKLLTTANILVDMQKQRAELQDWKGKFANLNWTGQLFVKNLNHAPVANGNMQFQPFALQDLRAALGGKLSELKANNVKVGIDFSFDAAKGSRPLQQIGVNALIHADDLQSKNVKATNVMAKAQLVNGILNLSPITAVLYQGNLQSTVKVDLNNVSLPVSLDANIINVQAENLFNDLAANNSLKVKGTANIELHATTSGSGKIAIRHNLNGNGKFSFNNGVLQGVDIPYWANTARALIKKQEPAGSDTGQTSFGNLTGTLVIHNGVISNNDLLLQMPAYITSGKGTIDLVNEQINYSLNTKAKMDVESDKKDLMHLYGLSIPIVVTGNFAHPKVGLDMGELMKQAAKQQIEKQKDQVLDKIKNQIPGDGGKILQDLLGS